MSTGMGTPRSSPLTSQAHLEQTFLDRKSAMEMFGCPDSVQWDALSVRYFGFKPVSVWSFRRDVGEPALVIKWRHSDFAWLCKDSSVNRRCGDTPLLLWEMCWCWLQVGQDSGMSYLWLFTLHVICHCWYFVTNFNTLSMATGGLRLQSADDVRLGLEIGLYVNCRHSIECQKCKCAISFHKHDSDIFMQS